MRVIDAVFVVLLCFACSFRVDQYNYFKIHVANGTVQNSSYTNPFFDFDDYKFSCDLTPGSAIERLNGIIVLYTVIILLSLLRVIIGSIIAISNCRQSGNVRIRGPILVKDYSLISFLNLIWCITMVCLYQEDIIGDDALNIELLVGLIGIMVNVSALVITEGYDCSRDARMQQQVTNRRLARLFRQICRNTRGCPRIRFLMVA